MTPNELNDLTCVLKKYTQQYNERKNSDLSMSNMLRKILQNIDDNDNGMDFTQAPTGKRTSQNRTPQKKTTETKKSKTEAITATTSTQNRFSPLFDEETNTENRNSTEIQTKHKNLNNNTNNSDNLIKVQNNKKRTYCPPIIVPNLNTKEFKNMVKDNSNDANYSVKIGRHSNIIKCDNIDSHKTIIKILKEKEIDSHTYTLKENKKQTILMRGVHHTYTPDEIKEDIKFQLPNLKISNIKNFVTPRSKRENIKLNMFTIQLEAEQTITELTKIRKICEHTISWERLHKREIIQCLNCQRFGHVAANCNYKYRCVKCTSEHEPNKCPRQSNEDANFPIGCVNCKNGNHPANYRGCAVYRSVEQSRKNKIQETRSRIHQQQEASRFAQQSARNLVNKKISFADIVSGKTSRDYESQRSSQPIQVTNPVITDTDPMSFCTNTSNNLFGCDLFTLMKKINNFLPTFNSLNDRSDKQSAYLQFAFSLCSTNQ